MTFCSLRVILNILLSVIKERHYNQNHKRQRLQIKYLVPCKINSSSELKKKDFLILFCKNMQCT